FAKTVRRNQQEMAEDDGQSIFDHQREKRSAKAFLSRETGMFVLTGEFDPMTGARIDTVLAAKERELWNAEDPKERRTPQQRVADALAELILEPGKGKAKGTALMVVADYDVINQELVNARLADGTPIPTAELIRLACDADLLPGVFRAATQEMNLGRKRRTASDLQRAALIYRDKECIGCGASAHRCFAHHVRFWKNGGPTDMPNLVLVCNRCHHNIHDEHWDVTQDPASKRFNVDPPPDPFPDTGVDSYRPSQCNPVLLN
ncbi:MAG: HNH endonuclease, partial [Acidimicrobiia bacterium]|nr:HNH endonuclease [Acidimicrobiia bacterium]